MVNHTKSKAMSVNLSSSELEALKTAFPFHWFPSLPYLVIRLTPRYEGLYQANFPPLFRNLKDMLSSWFHLPLSWFNKITAVRMSSPNCYIYLRFYQSRFSRIFYVYNSASSWNLYGAPLDPESANRCYTLKGLTVVFQALICKLIIWWQI